MQLQRTVVPANLDMSAPLQRVARVAQIQAITPTALPVQLRHQVPRHAVNVEQATIVPPL